MADPQFKTTVWGGERIYMVDFSRARTGPPHRRFPDIDRHGYHDSAHPSEHGPIVSASTTQEGVTVLFHRTEISTTAALFAVSSNTGVLQITKPTTDGRLSSDRSQPIQFTAGANEGRAVIEIRYKWPDGPVIGRLYVQIYTPFQVLMQLHLVTVNGLGHASSFLGANCPNWEAKDRQIRKLIDGANEIWLPHGIVLAVDGPMVNTTWTQDQVPSGNHSLSDDECLQAGALSPQRLYDHVNVYLIPKTTGKAAAFGISVPFAKQNDLTFPKFLRPDARNLANGLYIFTSLAHTGQSIAHEMGHCMSLTRLNAAPNDIQGHSTGDSTGGKQVRDDSVTRRRVMYPETSLRNASAAAWRNDTGYGPGQMGGFVTYRQLPEAQDITFQESQRARDSTKSDFYAM